MGFVVAKSADWQAQGNSANGTVVSIPGMKAGDILVFLLCTTHASDVLTITGTTNAPVFWDSNINMGSIYVGGAGTLSSGYVVIAQADVATHTVTLSETGASNVGYAFMLVRPTVLSGGACTITTNFSQFFTTNAVSITCPQNAPIHPHDCRLLLVSNINNPNASLYTVAETASVENPAAAQTYLISAGEGGTSSDDVDILCNPGSVPSVLDTGSATLTESGATSAPKWWVRGIVISEGASDAAPAIGTMTEEVLELAAPILATGIDHDLGVTGADIIGRGGGGGISVY
jgi:hypothetical protein